MTVAQDGILCHNDFVTLVAVKTSLEIALIKTR